MEAQKPGFFTKRRVVADRLGKKPGFFSRSASRNVYVTQPLNSTVFYDKLQN